MAQNYPPGAAAHAATQQAAPQPAPVNTNAPYTFDVNGNPQLVWANDLNGALAHLNRVTRTPKLTNDGTIATVTAFQEFYVGEMVKAVFNTNNIHDNPEFPGINLFIIGHQKQASGHDVEAVCHALFATVLDRCTNGYRGPVTANRLMGGSSTKIETVDRDGTCQNRIDNVITALREWKSVCKEVLFSSSKINGLANAPATVAKDKMNQKHNNLTKKRNTQKDRGFGIDSVLGKDAAKALKTRGYFPPLSKISRKKGQFKKQNPEEKEADESREASSPQSQPEPEEGEYSSQYAGFGATATNTATANANLLAGLDYAQLLEFNEWSNPFRQPYPTNGAGGFPQQPPAYDTFGFGGRSQQAQQGQSYIAQQGQPYPYQQGRPSVPQFNQQYVPQQHPAPSAHPYNHNGFPVAQQLPRSYSGYGQGSRSVNYTSYGNMNLHAPYNTWTGPYGSFTSSPYGNPTSSMRNNNYGLAQDGQWPPATQAGGNGNGLLRPTGTTSVTPQPSGLDMQTNKFKHSRTATMDAQLRSEPRRVKRNRNRDDSPDLKQVDEEQE